MQAATDLRKKLEHVFEKKQASLLAEVITDAYSELVKTSDFNELKGIVKELAEAQKRTEVRMEDLAQAQGRTEVRMEELAQAQGRTEKEIRLLAKGMKETRAELGGLSRSVSYGFENEAYRMLPAFLKKNYGIAIKEKLVRAEIGGKEINIFGRAKRNGEAAIVVGEVKLRLDDRKKKGRKGDVFAELEDKVEAVRQEYRVNQIVRILVTHYATKAFVKKAQDRDVLVVQSFERQRPIG